MTDDAWFPDAGDLIWTDFAPTESREQSRRRPALVVSSRVFTAMTGLAVMGPITSRVRPFPSSVVSPPGLPAEGEVLTSNIRGIDILARPVIYAGASIQSSLADEVRAKLAVFITI